MTQKQYDDLLKELAAIRKELAEVKDLAERIRWNQGEVLEKLLDDFIQIKDNNHIIPIKVLGKKS